VARATRAALQATARQAGDFKGTIQLQRGTNETDSDSSARSFGSIRGCRDGDDQRDWGGCRPLSRWWPLSRSGGHVVRDLIGSGASTRAALQAAGAGSPRASYHHVAFLLRPWRGRGMWWLACGAGRGRGYVPPYKGPSFVILGRVQNTLVRIIRGFEKPRITRDLNSNQSGKRWCSAAVWRAAGVWQLTYTVEWVNADEGRYWIEIRSSHECKFVDNDAERLMVEFYFGPGGICQ
jgi:hypothetical protein